MSGFGFNALKLIKIYFMFLCHSYHSLRYGTISIEDLVQQAADHKVKVLALTDINTVTRIYDFFKLCNERNIKPIVGVDVRVDGKLYYVCLAKNSKGIAEMNKLLTAYNCEVKPIPRTSPNLANSIIIYPLDHFPETLSENEFIGIRQDELNLLIRPDLKKMISKMVIMHPVTFRTKQEYNLHKVLRAIDNNTLISKLKDSDVCKATETFMNKRQLLEKYNHYPQIIENTKLVIDSCSFDFDFSTPKNKRHFTDCKENDIKLLRKLAYEGFERIYSDNHEEARQRLEKELSVIDQLNFCGYFLITWDIVQYSNKMGFMHVGRGSGANSLVSYCIGITAICPLELDLYFERFLNLNRKTPPDFDIDWSWQTRDIILEYIFNKYGKDHVAFCGTNVEFKYRSIFREVGKAFGLPKEELDALATKPMHQHDDKEDEKGKINY